MRLTSKQSGLITVALDDASLTLSMARSNLVLARDLVKRDNGEHDQLEAAIGGLRLISTTVALEGYRWRGFHDARLRR